MHKFCNTYHLILVWSKYEAGIPVAWMMVSSITDMLVKGRAYEVLSYHWLFKYRSSSKTRSDDASCHILKLLLTSSRFPDNRRYSNGTCLVASFLWGRLNELGI